MFFFHTIFSVHVFMFGTIRKSSVIYCNAPFSLAENICNASLIGERGHAASFFLDENLSRDNQLRRWSGLRQRERRKRPA